jgi:hypothetical protein
MGLWSPRAREPEQHHAFEPVAVNLIERRPEAREYGSESRVGDIGLITIIATTTRASFGLAPTRGSNFRIPFGDVACARSNRYPDSALWSVANLLVLPVARMRPAVLGTRRFCGA